MYDKCLRLENKKVTSHIPFVGMNNKQLALTADGSRRVYTTEPGLITSKRSQSSRERASRASKPQPTRRLSRLALVSTRATLATTYTYQLQKASLGNSACRSVPVNGVCLPNPLLRTVSLIKNFIGKINFFYEKKSFFSPGRLTRPSRVA